MLKKAIIVTLLIMSFSTFAFAKQFYGSNFENDVIGKPPAGWELGFKGNGEAKVIADPLNPKNKVFAHSDLADNKARHDVGGVIWVVGNENMQDYIVEYDAYFPTDYYMGSLVRFVEGNSFYLFDRRQGAPTFDFYKRAGGGWTNLKAGAAFPAKPQLWFRFRIAVKGDTLDAYAKAIDDDTQFSKMKPLISAQDATYKTGKFGLYGLIYVDNVVIGETEVDLTIAVEPNGKATTHGEG